MIAYCAFKGNPSSPAPFFYHRLSKAPFWQDCCQFPSVPSSSFPSRSYLLLFSNNNQFSRLLYTSVSLACSAKFHLRTPTCPGGPPHPLSCCRSFLHTCFSNCILPGKFVPVIILPPMIMLPLQGPRWTVKVLALVSSYELLTHILLARGWFLHSTSTPPCVLAVNSRSPLQAAARALPDTDNRIWSGPPHTNNRYFSHPTY